MKNIARKTAGRSFCERDPHRRTILVLLSAGFLIGGVFGCVTAQRMTTGPSVLQFFQEAAQDIVKPSWSREIWSMMRWPAAAILLSILPMAGLTMPVLFFLRGFFMTCGMLSLAPGSELQNLICAGLMIGPACCLSIPVLFAVSAEGLLCKAELPHRWKRLVLVIVLCAPVLVLCMVLERELSPWLLHQFLVMVAPG